MAFPLGLEKQYLRAVNKFLDEIDKQVMREVRKNIDYNRGVAVTDSIKDIEKFLRDFMMRYENSPIVKRMQKTTENVMKSVNTFAKKLASKRANFQLPPVSTPELKNIIRQQTELIKTVGKEYLGKIQNRIRENIKTASKPSELVKMLEKDTGVERNKAKFWASDQLGKTYAKLSQKNQEAAGFSKFIWRTQRDARVRDTHAELEGLQFDWNDPPELDGAKRLPGEDYNCRCYAEPSFDSESDEPPQDRLAAQISILEKKLKN